MKLGKLIRHYRQEKGISQAELARRMAVSPSYMNLIEKGQRDGPRDYATILKYAEALELRLQEKAHLLETAGFPAESPLSPEVRALAARIANLEERHPETVPILHALLEAPFHFTSTQTQALGDNMLRQLTPQPSPALLVLDEMLGFLIAGVGEYRVDELTRLLSPDAATLLGTATWEVKRRILNAIPELLKLDIEKTTTLLRLLREDRPDPLWGVDIRRRAVEILPALARHDLDTVRELLRPRPGDDVYTVIPTIEAATDLLPEKERRPLLDKVITRCSKQEQEVLRFLTTLLAQIAQDPQAALQTIEDIKTDPDRLIKICAGRALSRLLARAPEQVLELGHFFFRRADGIPREHRNVRRAVVRSTAAYLVTHADEPRAAELLRLFVDDEDLHTRRAASDHLLALSDHQPALAAELAEVLIRTSRDPYLHNRVAKVRLRLEMKDRK
jgi:transcriptional regulator with XRE-family HTH domain